MKSVREVVFTSDTSFSKVRNHLMISHLEHKSFDEKCKLEKIINRRKQIYEKNEYIVLR